MGVRRKNKLRANEKTTAGDIITRKPVLIYQPVCYYASRDPHQQDQKETYIMVLTHIYIFLCALFAVVAFARPVCFERKKNNNNTIYIIISTSLDWNGEYNII